MEELGNLWTGADFIYNNQRYCLLEHNVGDNEVIAVKIEYDLPIVTGNTIVSFSKFEKVKYCQRKSKGDEEMKTKDVRRK